MHRDVAIILKCMAQIYHERDNFDQALGLYQQALTAARASLGIHAETASIFNKLGNLYYENQDFDHAIEMYEQGLEVERAVLHSLHPNIVVTLSNLGQVRSCIVNTTIPLIQSNQQANISSTIADSKAKRGIC